MEPDKDTSTPGRRFWPQFQLPTAASLQHRFYKYLLSKLTLLSNADLDQAEHPNSSSGNNSNGGGGGGGFGHIVLRNVELDGDKLSSYLATAAGGVVPAAYVRHGGLARLELELLATGGGGGGTRLVGDGVRITVALTRTAYSAATGDAENGGLEGLLERTTADLAESIIMPTVTTSGLPGAYSVPASPTLSPDTPEYDLTDSESSTTSSSARQDSIGYGLGDFSGVVNRVVDAAVSRLDVVLRDVRVRVLIIGDSNLESLEDMELELVIEDIRFRTAPDDGTRRVTFSDSGNFFAEDADLVDDDVPTNLKFIESYYGGPGVDERSGAGLGGSGMHASYSNTDLLLEEDLSVMVARNNLNHSRPATDEVVDFNGSKSVSSFEQRVQLHDSVLNFDENHFGNSKVAHKSKTSTTKPRTSVLSPTSFSDNESDDESDRCSVSDAGTAELPSSYVQAHEPTTDKPSLMSSTDARTPPASIDFCVKNFTWDMHDGYDWKYTRDVISQAISRVEYEAKEIRRFQTEEQAAYNQAVRQEIHSDGDNEDVNERDEGEDLVADVLFNSIYISMSTHQNANDLRKRINKDINDDTASETASVASSVSSSRASTPFRPSPSLAKELRQNRIKSLKLKRSKQHKVKIHLTGIHGNMSLFASIGDELSGDENDPFAHLLNRLDVRVTDAEILDNVATSTWNKFLTYMRSEGDREEGASMFHIIMENVKPVADLATAEIVLNVFVLPLRLHVDQDTLDFITRFFEFQDDRFDSLMAGLQDEIPFIQKADIRAIKVKLDYKPKKIDYAGLRSGHTTEFMNFFILDEAEMVLNHVKLYGIAGFPRLGIMLNGIWMPDIRNNQLGDVLAGLAPVRSIVRLGSGLRDLVVVPVREYRKDGRVIRSLQKGAWQFARNTTSELVKFGAKLAAGTQTFLEQAEQAMGGVGAAGRQSAPVEIYTNMSDDDSDDEIYTEASSRVRFGNLGSPTRDSSTGSSRTNEAVSLYANQPLTLKQGIYSAYDSLGHNLSLAKTAVASIKSDAVASGSAGGTAKAIMRATPIALIRPMIGATEAVSRTLLGATNQMDPNQALDIEEKYKHAALASVASKKK